MADSSGNGRTGRGNGQPGGLWQRLRGLLKSRQDEAQLRETLEEIIDEIKDVDREEVSSAPISSDERVMLSNILRLRHLTAYDVMVPRADIVAVDLDTPIDELIDVMSSAGHSRLPVYRDTLDEVVGIVHIKDVLHYMKERKETGDFDLVDLVRRILVVAPSMRVLDLLLEMRLSRVHMALVVDEFGGSEGIVMLEDVLEEVVGELKDEFDEKGAGQPMIHQIDRNHALVNARVEIDTINDALDLSVPEGDYETLAGFLISLAGEIPAAGDVIEFEQITFTVTHATQQAIQEVRVRWQ